jgi:uncharacterized protein YjbJ (UPF0337 family)/sporulation protein YlmC with PRC-barrel domain
MRAKTILATAIALAISGPALAATSSTAQGTYEESIVLKDYRGADAPYALRASDIIGRDVRNSQNEEVGEVDDLIISPKDNVVQAVIAVGGVLGIGEKLVAVPYEDLRVGAKGQDVYYDVTKDQLKSMQEFKYREGERRGTEIWTTESKAVNGEPDATDDHVAMNWDTIEGNWKQLKGKVQKEWGKLTNDDVDVIEGQREILVGRLQERYGISREEAEKQADSWARTVM